MDELNALIESYRSIIDTEYIYPTADGEVSVMIDPDAYYRAAAWLRSDPDLPRQVFGDDVPLPTLAGCPPGVDISWKRGTAKLLVYISPRPDDPIDFYGKNGEREWRP